MKDKTNIKRKLLTDRNLPNSDQISQRKDFNSINKNYNMIKNGLLKKALLWGGAIVGTAIVVAAIYLNGTTTPVAPKPDNKKQTEVAMDAFVLPPLPGKETAFSTFRICTKTGGIINYKTGSILSIPADAFLTTNNKSISDSIDIKYREFHNPYDIFLSGIPMKYDSAGTQYTFESAGMIEILAFDGNEQLKLNERKPIEITMASSNKDGRFNLYQLDTVTKNWLCKGKDKVMPISDNASPTATSIESKKPIASVKNEEEMIEPTIADPKKFCFSIGYNKKDFPELAAYDNVLFEVTDHKFKPAFYKINWDKISLNNSDTKGVFIVKLKKADSTISVNAKPVFDKENYDNALAKFESKHKQVMEERMQFESENESKLNKVNVQLASYNRRDFAKAAYRKFVIPILGIFNCDYPMPPTPIPLQIMVNFINIPSTDVKQIKYSTIYYIEKGKNTVYRFSKNEPTQINPKGKNLVWTITDKNEIAFFSPLDINKLSKGQPNNIRPVIAKNQEIALAEIRNFSN